MATGDARPSCKCHDEPMYRSGIRNGVQKWRCAVKTNAHARRRHAENPEPQRARFRRWYDSMPGVQYNAWLLRVRRSKALQRRREREAV